MARGRPVVSVSCRSSPPEPSRGFSPPGNDRILRPLLLGLPQDRSRGMFMHLFPQASQFLKRVCCVFAFSEWCRVLDPESGRVQCGWVNTTGNQAQGMQGRESGWRVDQADLEPCEPGKAIPSLRSDSGAL